MLLNHSETESVVSSRNNIQLFFTMYLPVNQTILFDYYRLTHFFLQNVFREATAIVFFFFVKPDFRGFFECRGELINELKRLNIATTFDRKSNGDC